jgi:hypothetical protein
MYKACFLDTPIERAAELQAVLRSMKTQEIDRVRKSIQEVQWVPPPVVSSKDSVSKESAFKTIVQSETATVNMPAQESKPTSAPSSAPETSTTAIIEPTNEIKIAEPIKPKTRKIAIKKVSPAETSIDADVIAE